MNTHLSTREAAVVIGCDESHVRRMIRAGQLAAVAHELPNGQRAYQIATADVLAARRRRQNENRGRPRKEN